MEWLWRELRYALRAMRRNAAFTAVVLMTLGLGIGGNAAILGVVNATFFSRSFVARCVLTDVVILESRALSFIPPSSLSAIW